MTQQQKEIIISALNGIEDALKLYHNETIEYANKEDTYSQLLIRTENQFFNTNIERVNRIINIILES